MAWCMLGPVVASGQGADVPSSEAPAVSNADRERAKQLYEDGLAAYRASKYSEAIDKLLEADRVMPSAAFSYNIALVYQAMGDKRSALRWLRGYLRQSGNKNDRPAIDKVRSLEAELQSRGLQQVTVLSKPPGATLKIDGNALGITPFTMEIVPGSHQVSLVLDGYQTAQKTFELRPDRSMDLEVTLTQVAQAAAPSSAAMQASTPVVPSAQPVAPVTAPPPSDAPRSHVRPWTWVSLSLGTALVGGAVIYELKREKDETDARSASQVDYQPAFDRMHSAQTTARILAVAGSVGLVTGAVLLTVDLTHKEGPVQAAYVGTCGTLGACAALRGQF
jgi:tetratricopeptide (TPR) repeat protein